MSEQAIPIPDRLQYTPAQRRRAEALILVRALFPLCSPEQAGHLARWITRGEKR